MGKFEIILIVFLIALLLFGAKKIPELARSIGESMKELRKGLSDEPKKNRTSSSTKPASKDTE